MAEEASSDDLGREDAVTADINTAGEDRLSATTILEDCEAGKIALIVSADERPSSEVKGPEEGDIISWERLVSVSSELLLGRLGDAKMVGVSIVPSDEEAASSGVIARLDRIAVSGNSRTDFVCVSPNEID